MNLLFADDRAARSWTIPGGLLFGNDVPSLRGLEPVPAAWMEKRGRGNKVYTPAELLAEVRRRWGRGDAPPLATTTSSTHNHASFGALFRL